jgi:hypothetical protein
VGLAKQSRKVCREDECTNIRTNMRTTVTFYKTSLERILYYNADVGVAGRMEEPKGAAGGVEQPRAVFGLDPNMNQAAMLSSGLRSFARWGPHTMKLFTIPRVFGLKDDSLSSYPLPSSRPKRHKMEQ